MGSAGFHWGLSANQTADEWVPVTCQDYSWLQISSCLSLSSPGKGLWGTYSYAGFCLIFLEDGQFSLEQYLLGVREAGLGKRRSWTVLSQPFRELWNGHVPDWVMMSPGPLCPCKQAVPGKESWPWARQLPLAKGNCWGGLGYGPARNQQHPGSRRKIVSALKRKLVGVQQDLLPILQLG